jgi:DME family drug/metabolite transporter
MTDHEHRARLTAVASVLASAALFGTTGTAQALGPVGTTPLGVGSARIVIGGLGLLAILPMLDASRRSAVRLWRTPWGIAAGLMTTMYQVCFFGALVHTGVALGTLVTIGTGPILGGLLSWLILRDRPTLGWLIATFICIAGLALLIGTGIESSHVEAIGFVLSFMASAGYALYTVGAKHMINSGHSSDEVMASAFGLGALISIPILLSQPLGWIGTAKGIAMVLWLGLVATTLAYVLFGRGLRHLSAGPVTTLLLAEPVVATFLGVVVLGERLSGVQWVGALLVLIGLALQGFVSTRRRTTMSEAASSSTESIL